MEAEPDVDKLADNLAKVIVGVIFGLIVGLVITLVYSILPGEKNLTDLVVRVAIIYTIIPLLDIITKGVDSLHKNATLFLAEMMTAYLVVLFFFG